MSFIDWLILNGFDPQDANGKRRDYLYLLYQKSMTDGNKALYQNYVDQYKKGDMTAIDLQGALANSGVSVSPEQTQWINNEISQQVTNEARDYNTQMRDTDLTSAANQLSGLGLNPASVIQTGGSGTGSSGMVADTSKGNPAQEKYLADFNSKAAMTRTIVSLIGGLGAAGIYGGSRLLAQKAANVAASATANSGMKYIKKMSDSQLDKKWNQLLDDLDF